jgi:CubicO group peptidase (beta-lactamase class C family)
LKTSTTWNAFGDLSSAKTFGHSGASGTVAWADPERELLCVILHATLARGQWLLAPHHRQCRSRGDRVTGFSVASIVIEPPGPASMASCDPD